MNITRVYIHVRLFIEDNTTGIEAGAGDLTAGDPARAGHTPDTCGQFRPGGKSIE